MQRTSVIYHHFVKRILLIFVDIEEFLFSYEFSNCLVHLYQFEPLGKNENEWNKNYHSLTWNFWSYQTITLLEIIPLLFSSEYESDFILYMYKIHQDIPLRVTCVFQFVRVYVRINSLIMLSSTTSSLLRELTIHDNVYPIY